MLIILARPDLSFAPEIDSSIALSQAEFEWEVLGYYAPHDTEMKQDSIWQSIDAALEAISEPLEAHFSSLLSLLMKVKRTILSVIKHSGVSFEEIAQMNLQQEFMRMRVSTLKSRPSRSVNLLGRLNRLFYQPEHIIPSLQELHDVLISA